MDIEDFKKMDDLPVEALDSGLHELLEEAFRIKRWFDTVDETIDRLHGLVHSTEDEALKRLLNKAGGDLLEAGLILNDVAHRDAKMIEAAQEVIGSIKGRRMSNEIEEFLKGLAK